MIPDFDHQVLKLTMQFYSDHPNPPYKEIELKTARRYNCLIVQTHYDYYICIPFRSNVKHKYAFHFKKSARSRRSHSALDYSKIVIISDSNYLDSVPGIVDSDEYTEMMKNINVIVRNALEYVDDYVSYLRGDNKRISDEEFLRRYKYSTLQYFHGILGLP